MAFDDDDEDYDAEELLGDDHEDEIMDYGFEDPMDKEEESENREFDDEFLDADDDGTDDDTVIDVGIKADNMAFM